jgi:hypothetical protein
MKVFAWGSGLLGVLLMAIGLALCVHTWQFIGRAQAVPGEVVELIPSGRKVASTTYKARVQFEAANGEVVKFVSRMGSAPAAYREGEAVTVYVDPASPRDARLKSFIELWGVSSIVGGIGAVFFLIGAGFGVARWRKARKLMHLRASGDLVLATLEKIEIDTRITLNDRHPWRVHAHWTDPVSGQRHLFVSDACWEDPTLRVGQMPIQVYVERDRSGRYAMDLS